MSPREWSALIALACLWGIGFIFYELSIGTSTLWAEGTAGFGPLTTVLLRIAPAALILLAVLALTGRGLGTIWPKFHHYLLVGTFNTAVPFAFFAIGQENVNSGLAAVINAFTPIPTFLLAMAVGQERMNAFKIVGMTVGIGGVALLILPSLGDGVTVFTSGLVILLAPFCYAAGSVYARRHLRGEQPLTISAGILTAGGLATLPVAVVLPLIAGGDSFLGPLLWELPTTLTPWLGVAGLALPATVLAFPIFFWLLRNVGATNTVLVTLLTPVVAIVAGVILLQERFEYTFFIGVALITLSLMFVDGRLPTVLIDRINRLRTAP